jgi:hypothetical protein
MARILIVSSVNADSRCPKIPDSKFLQKVPFCPGDGLPEFRKIRRRAANDDRLCEFVFTARQKEAYAPFNLT